MKHEAPIPFRQTSSGNLFKRSLVARTIAALNHVEVIDVATKMWPNDRALADLLATRAASNPAMTGVVGWAAEIVHKIVADTVSALSAASGAADCMEYGLVLNWDGAGIISAPGFVASPNFSGFVQEGNPIPVKQLPLGPSQMTPKKLATIASLTREMMESSNAETLITDALVRSSGLALDAVFFSTAAASAAAPAGIRNGIAALTPSANADPFGAVFEDVQTLINAVSVVGGKGPFVMVGSAANIVGMNMRFDVDSAGDPAKAIKGVISSQVSGDLICIAAQGLVSAISPEPEIESVGTATLVMDDTAPALPDTTQSTKSMFQTESIAVKVRWPVSWTLRDTRAVAWLTPAWK